MGCGEDLLRQGWRISAEGLLALSQDGSVTDNKAIGENALNTDIKDFGEPFLSTEIKQSNTGKVILQIQKIRNVSAPKNKEESQAAPRMLKLTLTDGHSSCQAVELSHIPFLSSSHIPPGSKLLVDSAKIFSGCILLHSGCCALLGGKVLALFEKWELAKNISQNLRINSGTDGPPPWVNFGTKIMSATSNEPFKSLTSKPTKETINEFDVHRQDAIASASTGAVKKVFGGGSKALQDNALSHRKYNNARGNNDNQSNYENREYMKNPRGRREPKEKALVDKLQKPAEKVSLLDFLENKLPVSEAEPQVNSNVLVDNNFSKSEVRNESAATNSPVHIRNNNMKFYSTNKTTSQSNEKATTDKSMVNNVESLSRNIGRLSLNSQFASRSLQRHLNLTHNRNESTKAKNNLGTGSWEWKIGDLCMAKYWEDGKYYNAVVTNLTDRTCVVQFNGYGNVEEVLKSDCIPITDVGDNLPANNSSHNRNYKGSAGFRNYRRPYNDSRTWN